MNINLNKMRRYGINAEITNFAEATRQCEAGIDRMIDHIRSLEVTAEVHERSTRKVIFPHASFVEATARIEISGEIDGDDPGPS